MFAWFRKSPASQLRDKYNRLLREARDLQRNGNIQGYALKTAEADEVLRAIDALDT